MPEVRVHVTRCTLDARHLQGAGVVQGGVLAGVLGDAIDGCAHRVVGSGSTIELETMDVSFERPALPGSFDVHASMTRRGRSLLAFEARLVDASGRTVASARSTHRVTAAE